MMHIDCDTCEVRGLACGDCVVSVLLGSAPDGHEMDGYEMDGYEMDGGEVDRIELDSAEQTALAVLAASGLVPPLRLRQAVG